MRATCNLGSLRSQKSWSGAGLQLCRFFRHPPPRRKLKVEPKTDEERASRGLPLREPWFEVKPANEKQKNFVLRLKDVLQKPRSRKMEVADLGRLREELDVVKKGKQKKISVYVRRFPTAFDLETYYTHNNRKKTWCSFTAEAQELLQEEAKILEESEGVFVDKLRKLLMISVKKRLPFGTIKDVRPILGLPVDFKERLVNKNPDVFLFKERKGYLYLELKVWDEKLAISAVERSFKGMHASKHKGNNCLRKGIMISGHENERDNTTTTGDTTIELTGCIVNSAFESEGEDWRNTKDKQGDYTTEDEQQDALTEDEEGDASTEDEEGDALTEDDQGDATTEYEQEDSAMVVDQGYTTTDDEQGDWQEFLSEESHVKEGSHFSYSENLQGASGLMSGVAMPIGPSSGSASVQRQKQNVSNLCMQVSEEETLASDDTLQNSLTAPDIEEQQKTWKVSIVEATTGQQQTLASPKCEAGASQRISRTLELKTERSESQVGEDRTRHHHKHNGVQERVCDVDECDDSVCLHFPWKAKREPSIRRSEQIEAFQSAPYVSPYKNSRDLELPHHRWAADKFAVGIIHEFLSLTLEKRATLEQLDKLRRPYGLPKHLQGFLLRFDGIFYVAKAATGSGVTKSHVFLKEAYKHSTLIEKHPLVLWQERFVELAFKSKQLKKRQAKKLESYD